jgi:ankyrin
MGRLEILKEIKSLIFSDEKVEAFKDAKVGDYILRVEADEFAEGLQVYIVTEDGVTPTPPELAGEHVLEDGTKITLDESGIITKVEAGEAVEEEVVEEELAEEVVEEEKPEEDEKLAEEVKEEIKEEIKEELAEEVKEDVKEKVEEKLEEEKPEDEVVAALTERIEKLESDIEEMLALTKETAQFSSIVNEKLGKFVENTPAELEFKSVKSQYQSTVKRNLDKKGDKLEELRKFRINKK